MSITPETRIQDVPYGTLRNLADILDMEGDKNWKALISVMPPNSYTMPQISNLDRVGRTRGGSSTMELLKDFANLLKTVGELITYLEAIDNQQALLLIKPREPVEITQHPESVVSQYGGDVVFRCKASGFPCPRYQWYKGHNILPNQMSTELKLRNVQMSDAGDYYCMATNPIGSAYTRVACLDIIPQVASIVNGVSGPPAPPSTVSSQPYEQIVYPYQDFSLKSNIHADHYQWYKNGYLLDGKNQYELTFKPFLFDDVGFYTCMAYSNGIQTQPMTVSLVLPNNIQPPDVNFNPTSSQYASGKVALIIANKDYPNCFQDPNKELIHPINDALTLKRKLEELKFAVICLINLNFHEMNQALENFCHILNATPDMYSLFYFCGHGFEEHGNTYLLPVDITTNWPVDNSISSNDVRFMIQQCKTKFDVFLFDVCRESSRSNSVISPTPSGSRRFISGRECVIGYSTCPQSQAFEKRQDRNGIYMKHLAMHITENISVETLMQSVCEAVREEAALHHLTNDMHPSYTSMTTKSFSLADAILPLSGFDSRESDPVNICFNYHRLPSMRLLHFPSNIICELSFEEVCSNICMIIVYVANYGDAIYCDAKIVDIVNEFVERFRTQKKNSFVEKKDLDVSTETSNVERSVLTNIIGRSLPTNDSSSASSMTSVRSSKTQRETQVAALQRLKDTFKVRVRVTYETVNGERGDKILEETYSSVQFGVVSFFGSDSSEYR